MASRKSYAEKWVTGFEKGAYRGGWRSLAVLPDGPIHHHGPYHDHPASPVLPRGVVVENIVETGRRRVCQQDVELQATEKAKVRLGKTRHVPKNIPAMDWREVPAFHASLEEPTPTHLALQLLILTGVRTGPLRHLRLDQIEGDVWTVPADAMKGREGATEAFRVPLSTEAKRIIDLARPHARNGFLFPNNRQGVISDMTLSRHMERRGLEARPHGFRTSLRTWLAEATDTPHEVAGAMSAHATMSDGVRAYRRTDYLEQRRALAEHWADHVTGGAGQGVTLAGAG